MDKKCLPSEVEEKWIFEMLLSLLIFQCDQKFKITPCHGVYIYQAGLTTKELMQVLPTNADWYPHKSWETKIAEKQRGGAAPEEQAGQRKKILAASW